MTPCKVFLQLVLTEGRPFQRLVKVGGYLFFHQYRSFLFVIRDVHYFWPTLVLESSSVLDMMKLAC